MSKICFLLPQTGLEIVLISATNVPTSHQKHLDCHPDTVLKLCSLLQRRLWSVRSLTSEDSLFCSWSFTFSFTWTDLVTVSILATYRTTDLIISLTPSCEFFFSVSVEVLNQEMSRTCSAHPEVNLVFDSLLQILFCKRCCVCFWRETSLNMCRVTMKTHSVLFGSVLFGPLTAVLLHVVIDYFGCVSTLLWALLSVSVLLLTIKLNWISIICCFNSSTLLLWCLNE